MTGGIHGKEKGEAACYSSVVEGRREDAAKHGEGEDIRPRDREEIGADARCGIAESDAVGGAVSIYRA
jgi:hypothetical protein